MRSDWTLASTWFYAIAGVVWMMVAIGLGLNLLGILIGGDPGDVEWGRILRWALFGVPFWALGYFTRRPDGMDDEFIGGE